MNLALCLLSASLAAAQTRNPSVAELKERFQSAVQDGDRGQALALLRRTPPVSAQDVTALFDLFERFPTLEVRRAAMDSLALMPANNPTLEPLFVRYLKQPEPNAQLFGVNGAFRLRSLQALPLVRRIAGRRFDAADASDISVLSGRNAWWTQYEALSALAQWEGEKALPLLRAKTEESPAVARLLGSFFWRQTFPSLRPWSQSKDEAVRRRAAEAAAAAIDPADARATREEMLAVVGDPAADAELRHQFALKAGACSADEEVDALLKAHDAATDDKTRLLWAAAAFASLNPRAAPLLARYALRAPDEASRNAARAQLEGLLGPEKSAALLAETEKTGPGRAP
ncbi:MAG: hypothetical protein HY552_04845 [Elusimicrobia bacterium]|nr:hypothetical protein [Elusimicrobiota bacterium]